MIIDEIGYWTTEHSKEIRLFHHLCPKGYDVEDRYRGSVTNYILNKGNHSQCKECKKTWEIPYENLMMLAKMKEFRKSERPPIGRVTITGADLNDSRITMESK